MSARWGKPPELAWVPVTALRIDPAYQRSIETRRGRALIDKIVEGFHWPRFGAILVCRRPGEHLESPASASAELAGRAKARPGEHLESPASASAGPAGFDILDGQHRTEAARRLGIAHLPAVVVEAGSTAEAARAFIAANRDRVIVNVHSLHYALLAAGDFAATRIDAAARAAGIEITRWPIPRSSLKPGQTLAIATIGRIIRDHATICAGTVHAAEVRAFLMKYYGTDQDPALREPLHTATTRDRFGLVMVRGEPFRIVDIGMRMLTPRELFRAQGFPDGYVIDPTIGGKRLTKTAQIRMVGNSVCPPVAEALVAANLGAEVAPAMAAE